MKRRTFLKHSSLAAASTTAIAACTPKPTTESEPASTPAQPFVRWRMATSWPKSLNFTFGTAEQLCQRVSRLTNGRFAITPYAAGEIVSGLEVLAAIEAGTVECGHTASYYYVDRLPALAFATTVPFGLNAQQQNAWLQAGGGLALIQNLYADWGIINFPGGSTGAQMGGWFKTEVDTLDDLKGLKMRIPGLGGQVMARLGMEVQVLPGDQIFDALDQGKLDAAEWVGPHDDEQLGLNRVAPFYYSPGWWEPGTTYEFQVNLAEWQKLPSEYREAFEVAASEAHNQMLANYDAANGQALQRLLFGGTELREFSPEILQAAQNITFELYEDKASQDSTFKQIYQQWKAFRSQVYQWHRVNEFGFVSFPFKTINP
ncbi:TRAP transporter substrate-binding protein [Lyngbya sp. PCC 8106]|uniref:TRAP transporter substrate-binding protein n=1 Tax=Lyngbya sp. (strain PCC 8106) TaxID=313612 RepID=UPI000586A3F0|nr:TRAP transporter substrate-binding protein [Lyngbya sp. PCC 8106]